MMKKFLFVITTLTFFASCKNETGSFTVTGKIENPPADSVYLQQLSYEKPDSKTIDSAKLGANGSYTLKANSPQQNLYVISFKDNPAVILVNDATSIKINFNLNGFHYPDITGSAATKELYSFIQDFFRKDSALSVAYYQLDSLNKETAADTAYVSQVQLQYSRQLNELDDVIRNEINNSKNPAIICFAIDKAKGIIAPDELVTLVQNASKRFPDHTGITSFKNSLSQASSNTENSSAVYGLLNKPAPDLTMPDVNGKNVSISNYKGKYLLVDFWASWCGPCRQENPNVVMAYNKFKNKNFTILGVSLDNDKAAWKEAVKNDHLTWQQMSDLQTPSAAADAYRFDAIPFNVLIDPQGNIIASGLRGEALEQKLSEVLK